MLIICSFIPLYNCTCMSIFADVCFVSIATVDQPKAEDAQNLPEVMSRTVLVLCCL